MQVRAVVGIVVGALVLTFVLGTASCSDDDASPPDAEVDEAAAESGALVADFDYEVDTAETGTTSCPVISIAFTDTSTGGPTEWEWDFGPDLQTTEQNPSVDHPIDEATLTVSRGDESDTVTLPVQIPVC